MTAQTYEAWRISYQSSEQAARAAFARVVELEEGRRAIIAEKDEYKLALRQARADLEAIGAGGVESLCGAKPLTHDSIADWVSDTWPMDKKFSLAEIESRIRANGIGT